MLRRHIAPGILPCALPCFPRRARHRCLPAARRRHARIDRSAASTAQRTAQARLRSPTTKWTFATLQARMATGELDSHRLTQAYLDRIAAIDKAGPRLNSVIELNPMR
jgi:amidase